MVGSLSLAPGPTRSIGLSAPFSYCPWLHSHHAGAYAVRVLWRLRIGPPAPMALRLADTISAALQGNDLSALYMYLPGARSVMALCARPCRPEAHPFSVPARHNGQESVHFGEAKTQSSSPNNISWSPTCGALLKSTGLPDKDLQAQWLGYMWQASHLFIGQYQPASPNPVAWLAGLPCHRLSQFCIEAYSRFGCCRGQGEGEVEPGR